MQSKKTFIATLIMVFGHSLIASQVVGNDKIVAKVNKVKIRESTLVAEANKKLPFASFHSRVSEEKFQEIRSEVLQILIEEELLYQEAVRRQLAIRPDEVNKHIDRMKSGFSTEADFENGLAKSGLNRKQLSQRITRDLTIKRLLEEDVYSKVIVNNEVLRNYYQKNNEKFILPKQLHVRHILVSVHPGGMKVGWQEGSDKAEDIYSRIDGGEDFAEIAIEVSDDTTSKQQGGDIGWFHEGQLLPELEEALLQLNIGEFSRPIRSIYGYHLIRLEGLQPAKQLSFNEIDIEGLKKKLIKKKKEESKREFIENLKSHADIRIIDF